MSEPSKLSPELQRLVIDHMRVAKSIAVKVWRSAPHVLELDELISQAYLGLTESATRWPYYCAENNYDPARTEFFMPYITRRVHGKLIDEVRKQDHVQRSMRDRLKLIREAGWDSGVGVEVVCMRTGLSRELVIATVQAVENSPVHLDETMDDKILAEDVETAASTSNIQRVQAEAIASLPESHQVVLALRYFAGLELKEIAQRMAISESRASHVHTEAVLVVLEALEANFS